LFDVLSKYLKPDGDKGTLVLEKIESMDGNRRTTFEDDPTGQKKYVWLAGMRSC